MLKLAMLYAKTDTAIGYARPPADLAITSALIYTLGYRGLQLSLKFERVR